ncbi:MAG: hypothetical protein ACI3WR_07035 [Oscillospiraceae bacterium]
MKDRLTAVSIVAALAVQALFFAVLLCFRSVPAVGDGFFHVLTRAEWDWLVSQPQTAGELKLVAIVTFLRDILLVTTLLCLGVRLVRRPHRLRDALCALWLAAYLPVFFAVRTVEHYALWMTLLPLEFLSLALLTLTLLQRPREPAPQG